MLELCGVLVTFDSKVGECVQFFKSTKEAFEFIDEWTSYDPVSNLHYYYATEFLRPIE